MKASDNHVTHSEVQLDISEVTNKTAFYYTQSLSSATEYVASRSTQYANLVIAIENIHFICIAQMIALRLFTNKLKSREPQAH